MRLKSAQRKGLSEFFNSVAVAWFAAGVVAPVFVSGFIPSKFVGLAIFALLFTGVFLGISIGLLRRSK